VPTNAVRTAQRAVATEDTSLAARADRAYFRDAMTALLHLGNACVSTLAKFPPTRRYVVGVSGGRDSIALLHWLIANGYRKLIVCHLDHRLRGRSSTTDAQFVARLADSSGLAFETARVDVRKLASQNKQSIETAARAARYSFFAEVARRRRCSTILLGHHADDLVETFLFNLFRGAGTSGQRGMRAVAKRTIDGVALTIVRPLLSVSREEIDVYVREHRLRFREDSTNAALDPLRNRMRHRIIPMLVKEFGRDIRKAVRRAALIAADENAFLHELVPTDLYESETIDARQLASLPVALQRRAIAQWLRAQSVSDIGFEMVEQVRALLDPADGPAKINLTRDRHARRRAGKLFIE
jgi:tRNA(Ile)-lysidine synthase